MHAATPERSPAMLAASPGASLGASPGASPGAVRLPRWAFPLVTIASLLLGATSIVRGTRAVVSVSDSDLTNFFLRSADYILRGDPWHMYAVRALGGYPNYNPPLSMFLLAPLLGLARAVGFAGNYGEQITFVTLPFIVLVPLMGYLGLRVMRALYPAAPETLRLLLYAFITLSPLTWQSYNTWYHVEQPLMLCLLLGAVLALQARREGLAGLLAGLAFLSRTTALIPLIALGVLLLLTRDWRPLLKFGGVSAVVAALGFAPFVAFDASDVKYTFLTWRGGAPIGSDSIWTIFAYTGTSSHLRSLINAAAKRIDMYVVILVVVVAAILVVWRLRLRVTDRDVWALLAIAMLATPMLSKQVWPYYYLEPAVFIAIWELSTLQDRVAGVWRWPVLSITFTLVAATLSQYIWLQSVGGLDRLLTGVTQTGLMAAFTLCVWARMQARKPAVAGMDAAQVGMQGMPVMTPPGVAAAGVGALAAAQAPQPNARDSRGGGMGGMQPQQPQPPQAPQSSPPTQGGDLRANNGGRAPLQQARPYQQAQAPLAPAAPTPPGAASQQVGRAPAWPNAAPNAASGPAGGTTPLWPNDSAAPNRGPASQTGANRPGGPPSMRAAPPAMPPAASYAAPNAGPPPAWRAPSPRQTPPQAAPQTPPQTPPNAQGQRGDAGRPPDVMIDPWRDWPQGR